MSKLAHEAREHAQATGELPHEFMLRMTRGERITRKTMVNGKEVEVEEVYDIDKRLDAAKASAPYYAPKISTVELISGVADDDLDSLIAELAAKTGLSVSADGEDPEDPPTGAEAPRARVKLNGVND